MLRPPHRRASPEQPVAELLIDFEKVRVAAAHHQRQRGKLHRLSALLASSTTA